MCDTCGCVDPNQKAIISKPGKGNDHGHEYKHDHKHAHNHGAHKHSHSHHYHHDEKGGKRIPVGQDILSTNNLLAERNRGFFEARQIKAFNLVSSPGSGKTTILEKTIAHLNNKMKFYIIEGDQQSMLDAERIDKTGAPVVQVNTGSGCHLDADMVNRAVKELDVPENACLMIENVGNLVCPSLFDLGESERIVVISTTEGNDKPLKYPDMFASSDICIINKTDLVPYVDADIDLIKKYARRINPKLKFFEMSAKTGEGMDAWYDWLSGKK
jgi:hydrogenase nickel incorporation protein HypB